MAIHIPASRSASCLGLIGLIPFIVLATCLWVVAPAWQNVFASILAAYGAMILTFLGAIHWGAALEGDDHPAKIARYGYSIMPGILAWATTAFSTTDAFFVLFLGFMLTFAIDRQIYADKGWFVILRAVCTGIACASLYAAYKALQH